MPDFDSEAWLFLRKRGLTALHTVHIFLFLYVGVRHPSADVEGVQVLSDHELESLLE